MPNLDQIKLVESIRELTLDELQAVSGGGDDSGDGDLDGGGPVPTCPGSPGC
jgi:bacteriocin-like protein